MYRKLATGARSEARRMRREERLSIGEIARRVGASGPTVYGWIRDMPLTREERAARVVSRTPKKDRGQRSKFHAAAPPDLPRHRKAKIAEAAVLFRLALYGFNPYTSVFDGDRIDWLVEVPESGKLVKLEVRWAAPGKHGLPTVSLRCADGRFAFRRYREQEFDFIVAYDLFSDTAYVFAARELARNSRCVTVRPDAAERWDKLRA